MNKSFRAWDYLIITSTNKAQADLYKEQIRLREKLGLIPGVKRILVVADPEGKRIGSGGSTLFSLLTVLYNEQESFKLEDAKRILENLRILIVHAGGDSKRLPSYSSCGKIFIPVPGENDTAIPVTLFDRQMPTYLALPPGPNNSGQVVIASGDVLLTFDPESVNFGASGIVGLGAYATLEEASKHGVFVRGEQSQVKMFLQKPSIEEQRENNAVDHYDRTLLDIGVMRIDADTAATLLKASGGRYLSEDKVEWKSQIGKAIDKWGLDFYREICCALGAETNLNQYISANRRSGSNWSDSELEQLFNALQGIPFSVEALSQCGFHHFGTSHQIIHSGLELLRMDQQVSQLRTCLQILNSVEDIDQITGTNAWIEGCRVNSELKVSGHNIVVGVDINEPLKLSRRCCLTVIRGVSPEGEDLWFVLCYGVDDLFKDKVNAGASFCSFNAMEWIASSGLDPDDLWDQSIAPAERTLWDARLFPAVRSREDFRKYLWFYSPEQASPFQKKDYKEGDRYSLSEISRLADYDRFYKRRGSIRAEEIRRSLRKIFQVSSGFSAKDLWVTLERMDKDQKNALVCDILKEAHWRYTGAVTSSSLTPFAFSRIIHTLGSALIKMTPDGGCCVDDLLPGLRSRLSQSDQAWLDEIGLELTGKSSVIQWAEKAKACAFTQMRESILTSGEKQVKPPINALRCDEIVWGRAPARLDMAGGWTDTPPYSLEHGGCVLNAAVNLNDQPPIQAFARVIPEPVIRIGSIDLGSSIQLHLLADLMNFKSPTSEFALAKAALALSGFSADAPFWPKKITLEKMLESFGGGIELTTLAAIPKGSGLGTSSIMGAVILSVLERMLGRKFGRQELFHRVMRLEQALTTGGGWQDQIGGAVDGVKSAAAKPGLAPEARIHFVPADVLDPPSNNGLTLLYYTGVTRLAKNILQQVVGRYLDCDRAAMSTLRKIQNLPSEVVKAMSSKDLPRFGKLIDKAWRLNKELDPNSSNKAIEELLHRIRPHIYGAKLLGAGGGGFLLMIARSKNDANRINEMLIKNPPNDRARFFDFNVSTDGLVVTVS